MSDHGPESFDADRLRADEIAALKERERLGREQGAPTFLERVTASRGAWRVRAEDLAFLSRIAPRPGQDVLDAGAGVGRHALQVAPRVRRLLAVDFSAAALRVLEDEARRRGLDNVRTMAADLCALPPLPERFDTAYSSEVLQHIPSHAERLAALRGLRAALVPGGRCVVNVACWGARVHGPRDGFWGAGIYRHYFTPAELGALFREAGFARVTTHPMLLLPGRVTHGLPIAWAALEGWATALRPLARFGRFLIGVGRA